MWHLILHRHFCNLLFCDASTSYFSNSFRANNYMKAKSCVNYITITRLCQYGTSIFCLLRTFSLLFTCEPKDAFSAQKIKSRNSLFHRFQYLKSAKRSSVGAWTFTLKIQCLCGFAGFKSLRISCQISVKVQDSNLSNFNVFELKNSKKSVFMRVWRVQVLCPSLFEVWVI